MADALEVFRATASERAQLEAAQAEQERHSAEEKQAALEQVHPDWNPSYALVGVPNGP